MGNQASESCEEQAEQVIVELPDTNRNDEKPDKPASETENQGEQNLGIVSKCHNIGREEGDCGKQESTHTGLTA